MTLEDEVRKCCEEIDSVRVQARRLQQRCSDEVKRDLSGFESKLERFVRDAREASETLNRGMRDGLQGAVDTWCGARDRLAAHLRLIEAKGFLASARRLSNEGDFVAAKNELNAAMNDIKEARSFLAGKDDHLTLLAREIEHAIAEIHATAVQTTASIEDVVSHNERLLEELKQAS